MYTEQSSCTRSLMRRIYSQTSHWPQDTRHLQGMMNRAAAKVSAQADQSAMPAEIKSQSAQQSLQSSGLSAEGLE